MSSFEAWLRSSIRNIIIGSLFLLGVGLLTLLVNTGLLEQTSTTTRPAVLPPALPTTPPHVAATRTARAQAWREQYQAQSVTAPLSIVQLAADYEANELAAERHYRGRAHAITGPIRFIGRDVLDAAHVTLGAQRSGGFLVKCVLMSGSERSALVQALQVGQVVTVSGRIGSYSLGILTVEHCIVLA